jgi:hypothetical protein
MSFHPNVQHGRDGGRADAARSERAEKFRVNPIAARDNSSSCFKIAMAVFGTPGRKSF